MIYCDDVKTPPALACCLFLRLTFEKTHTSYHIPHTTYRYWTAVRSLISSDQGTTYEATGPKEPMGRIHEIFGPTVKPYYTVRVEGTATQHLLQARYQTALKKLLDAEKV